MKERPVSRGTPAMRGEDRQKAWKKAASFQEQKNIFRVSSCFPTPSPAHSTRHLPASCGLPPQPQNSREDGKPRTGHCYPGRREEEEKDGPADIPLGHQLMADADSCAPMSSPTGWGRCSPRGHVAMSPRPSSDQNKRQPVLHQEQRLHDLPVKSSALPTLGSPMNTADTVQPCTLTIYRHTPFTAPSEVLLWPPAQRKEKLASGILGIQITI